MGTGTPTSKQALSMGTGPQCPRRAGYSRPGVHTPHLLKWRAPRDSNPDLTESILTESKSAALSIKLEAQFLAESGAIEAQPFRVTWRSKPAHGHHGSLSSVFATQPVTTLNRSCGRGWRVRTPAIFTAPRISSPVGVHYAGNLFVSVAFLYRGQPAHDRTARNTAKTGAARESRTPLTTAWKAEDAPRAWLLVDAVRFELTTSRLKAGCSAQLSYASKMVGPEGIEPVVEAL